MAKKKDETTSPKKEAKKVKSAPEVKVVDAPKTTASKKAPVAKASKSKKAEVSAETLPATAKVASEPVQPKNKQAKSAKVEKPKVEPTKAQKSTEVPTPKEKPSRKTKASVVETPKVEDTIESKPKVKEVIPPVAAKKKAKPTKKEVEPEPKKVLEIKSQENLTPTKKLVLNKKSTNQIETPVVEAKTEPQPKFETKKASKKAPEPKPSIQGKKAVAPKPKSTETEKEKIETETIAPKSKLPELKKEPVAPEPKTPMTLKKSIKGTKPSAEIGAEEPEQPTPTVRYSDEELEMFERVITESKRESFEELRMLKERLEDLNTYDLAEESMFYSMHMGEQGSEPQEKEKTYAQIQRINEYIKKLDEALQRIKDKTYGICRVCGILIAKERLLAVPITTLSASWKIHQRCPEDGIDRIEPFVN
ncbi:MAG: TraR/DksA C4-type zinc finger protein [Chloroherpetonaceae bacterium]